MKRNKNSDTRRSVVWITGASRGIGRELAKQFAFIGCVVCLSSRSRKALNSAVREINTLGGSAYTFPFDITQNKSVHKAHARILKMFGPVDVLINNAGISLFKTFLDTSLREFNEIISTNLMGHIACTKEVLPAMIRKKQGCIINIISMVAHKTYETSSAYTASKAGMLGLGKVLREEMKTHNIKVINVIPGATSTDIWHPKIKMKYGYRMMQAKSLAEAVLSLYRMPDDVVAEELIVRPVMGDLS